MRLGKLAIFSHMGHFTAAACAEYAQRVEKWGYSALWQPEGGGRDSLVSSSWLLANTETLIIATGIANLHFRSPLAMAGSQNTLAEQSGGRFLLGIGVSHPGFIDGPKLNPTYGRPLTQMRDYLTAMQGLPYGAPLPAEKPPTVIAALRPKMMKLASELADGAHSYNVTPEHTAEARKILGPDKLLCVEQKVIFETDAAKARAVGRETIALYLKLENYRASWLDLGFTEDDISGAGSDRFIDAMFAWGDESAIRTRIQQHWDAGATQVCIQPVDPNGAPLDEKVLAALAPATGWVPQK